VLSIDDELLEIPEAELAVLATALRHGGTHGVTSDDFSSKAGRHIWQAVEAFPDDWIMAAEMLNGDSEERPWLPRLGAIRWEYSRPAEAIGPYVRRLREYRALRDLGVSYQRVISRKGDLAELRQRMVDLERAGAGALEDAVSISQGLKEVIDDLDGEVAVDSLPTGIDDLDEKIGGVRPSHFVVIGARPAMGKTALMLNLARNFSRQGKAIAIFSAEQPRREVLARLVSIVSGVSLVRMVQRDLTDSEWTRVGDAMSLLKNTKITVLDASSPLIDEVAGKARMLRDRGDCDVVMVDYLQKLRSNSRDDFRLQIADIAGRLKDIGRDLDVPVIALAQCKREIEQRPIGTDGLGRLPRMSDLAESGVIEQEADVVLTLLRPSVYQEGQREGEAFVRICKNRHGPVGMARLAWLGECLRFDSMARGY